MALKIRQQLASPQPSPGKGGGLSGLAQEGRSGAGARRQQRPRARAGRPAGWAQAARGLRTSTRRGPRGLDSGSLGGLRGNF